MVKKCQSPKNLSISEKKCGDYLILLTLEISKYNLNMKLTLLKSQRDYFLFYKFCQLGYLKRFRRNKKLQHKKISSC